MELIIIIFSHVAKIAYVHVLISLCVFQNDPSLLNAKGYIKLRYDILDLSNATYKIEIFVYGFKTSNRLKSLLLITLYLGGTFD